MSCWSPALLGAATFARLLAKPFMGAFLCLVCSKGAAVPPFQLLEPTSLSLMVQNHRPWSWVTQLSSVVQHRKEEHNCPLPARGSKGPGVTCLYHHSQPAGVSSRAVAGNFGSLPNTLLLSNTHCDENRLQALPCSCLEVKPPHSPVWGLWHLKLPSWKEEKLIDDV